MKNNIMIAEPAHAYLRQFQVAQLNFANLLSEERPRKRIQSIKKKQRTND
jgi:hypothetical protein